MEYVYTNIEKENIDVWLLESHSTHHMGIEAYEDVGRDSI